MSEALTPDEEKALSELSEAVATELAKGTSKKKLVKELVKQNWAQETATEFVDSVEQALEQYKQSPEARRIMAKKHTRSMLFGGLWAAGGTIVTVVTYATAASGGVFFVAWGAILFGGIQFLWGLFGWLKYRDTGQSPGYRYQQTPTSQSLQSPIASPRPRTHLTTATSALSPGTRQTKKCPFCRSSDIQDEAGVRRCAKCQSILPSYIK